ncbi:MAG: D-glycero-beta-D-manno-heptose 1-phosphate adenylyltransferase [Bacteroidetes bacterium]|nr:D-glycero-beta-D-manno-heptose 1-phosphate adenylyltransferase [Bacteroidota bacterium]
MNKQELIERKIFNLKTLEKALSFWRFADKKIVFTNGCFDLLHLGHIDYLSKAASLGNILIVGLNSDASVSKLKGPHRPLNNENSRLHIMASLFFINGVILFNEDTPFELIKIVQPDILVKCGDYKVEDIVGYDIVKAKGGEISTIDYVPGYSTSAIERKIRDSSS